MTQTQDRTPEITVLMAVYNGSRYIGKSVSSILRQTHTDFEFLIINDTSTDNTLEVIHSFHDDRIRVHSNEANKGQARSLNIGLGLARGKYVARIDADDIAFPRWLETQYAYMKQHPEYAVVSTKAVVIDEHGKVRRTYDSPVRQEDVILRSFTFSPINHVGSLFDKNKALKNGGYVEEYKIAADFGLWSALIRNGEKITSTQDLLVAIRAHSSSFSQSASGEKELQDLSDIMRGNINTFTSHRVTDEESRLVCRAFFDEGSLDETEFKRAGELIKEIYGELIPSLALDRKSAVRWSKARLMAAYLKRIFFFLNKKDFLQAKRVLRDGLNVFGCFNPLGVIVVAGWFGKACMAGIPGLMEQLMRLKAYWVMKKDLKTVLAI